MSAFVPTLPFQTASSFTTQRCRTRARTACTSHSPATMLLVSHPNTKVLLDVEEEQSSKIEAPEVTAVAAAVCDFMNREHLRDLANYVVRFGQKFDDMSQLNHVTMTGLDASGFTTDVISCDDTSHCVCVQEKFDWPLGLCHSANDVIAALKYLSMACGLPADF